MSSPSGPWRVSLQENENNHTNSFDISRSTNKLHLTELKVSTVNSNSVKRQLQYPVENQKMISGNV